MKMYLSERHTYKITEIDVESETAAFVKIVGRKDKRAKTTNYDWVRATREEAKRCMVEHFEREVESAKRRLEYQEEELLKAKSA